MRAWSVVACVLVHAWGLAWADGGRDVGTEMRHLVEADWRDSDLAFAEGNPSNEAQGVTTEEDAAGGCDGVKNGHCGFHTASGEVDPWWQVDLGADYVLDRVVVFNRTDGATAPRARNLRILVALGDDDGRFSEVYRHNGETFFGVNENAPLVVALRDNSVTARVVRIEVPGRCSFALDEVEVYAAERPNENIALGKPADQKSVGPYSVAEIESEEDAAAGPEPADGGFTLAHTRGVIERGQALAARLRRTHEDPGLDGLEVRLSALAEQVFNMEAADTPTLDARRAVYFDVRRVVRSIAFCNPLLDFDRILFIKRHDPGGLFHMCHQFYGFNAVPGGGLFVLRDAFSEEPRLVNLLEDSVVQSGRLAGRTLGSGSFLSPELSFDGRTILFAYSEAEGEYPEWSPRSSYHVFRVEVDGTGLVQLTDGPWNDFDPCFLPSGRIAFISERRGGYLRCGGSSPPLDSPTYTLFSMASDGRDIVCLSYHETHEWQPSVNHDGMIVYTRWDYVDRDTNIAHHLWTCYPDGRDPRSFHGNYPAQRESRPWMEMDIRAVPNSPRYVATAAPHHGHAFGSLVSIDPRVEDDAAMSQVSRVTPDTPFPEAETDVKACRDFMIYGTPWPLSEDDYLCVYDRSAKNRGVYWLDRFGNRELLYRDPSISCVSPIPLRARPMPPAIPEGVDRRTPGAEATVAVINVYDSDFAWPEQAKVTALRIIQVLPKTTPPSNKPRIGAASQTNARAVLGTVPVEPDGSAHFKAPSGKLIYFQALDKEGMAIQSMRSGAYFQPGERMTCRGCHEDKYRAAPEQARVPLALRREPSKLAPECDGSNPFSYARLVQPVLDQHCVACHERQKALDLGGVVEGEYGWSRSYANLAGDYGFYFDAGRGCIKKSEHGGSRTIAGAFGARGSGLLGYLGEGHYGVHLPTDDLHRVTLWLDCNSEFYGAYENTEAQGRGEIVRASLD